MGIIVDANFIRQRPGAFDTTDPSVLDLFQADKDLAAAFGAYRALAGNQARTPADWLQSIAAGVIPAPGGALGDARWYGHGDTIDVTRGAAVRTGHAPESVAINGVRYFFCRLTLPDGTRDGQTLVVTMHGDGYLQLVGHIDARAAALVTTPALGMILRWDEALGSWLPAHSGQGPATRTGDYVLTVDDYSGPDIGGTAPGADFRGRRPLVTAGGQSFSAGAIDAAGRWRATVPAGVPSGPMTIYVNSSDGARESSYELDYDAGGSLTVTDRSGATLGGRATGPGYLYRRVLLTDAGGANGFTSEPVQPDGTWQASVPAGRASGAMRAYISSSDGQQEQTVDFPYDAATGDTAPSVYRLDVFDRAGSTISGSAEGFIGRTVVFANLDDSGSFVGGAVGADGRWSASVPGGRPSGPLKAYVNTADGAHEREVIFDYVGTDTPAPTGYPMRLQLTQRQIDNGIRLPRITDQNSIVLQFDAAGDDEADPGSEFTVTGDVLRLVGDLKLIAQVGDFVDIDVR